MKIFAKNFLLILIFMQSLAITEVIEKRLHKRIQENAIKESVELKNMVNRLVVEPRAYVKEPTEREKSLMLHYAQKARVASWFIFFVNLVLVAIFSLLAVRINKQKSNNSFKADVSGCA